MKKYFVYFAVLGLLVAAGCSTGKYHANRRTEAEEAIVQLQLLYEPSRFVPEEVSSSIYKKIVPRLIELGEDSVPAIESVLDAEVPGYKDEFHAMLAYVLSRIGGDRVNSAMIKLLRTRSVTYPACEQLVLEYLASRKDAKSTDVMVREMLFNENAVVREMAVSMLPVEGRGEVLVDALARALQDADADVRQTAAQRLRSIASERAIRVLKAAEEAAGSGIKL